MIRVRVLGASLGSSVELITGCTGGPQQGLDVATGGDWTGFTVGGAAFGSLDQSPTGPGRAICEPSPCPGCSGCACGEIGIGGFGTALANRLGEAVFIASPFDTLQPMTSIEMRCTIAGSGNNTFSNSPGLGLLIQRPDSPGGYFMGLTSNATAFTGAVLAEETSAGVRNELAVATSGGGTDLMMKLEWDGSVLKGFTDITGGGSNSNYVLRVQSAVTDHFSTGRPGLGGARYDLFTGLGSRNFSASNKITALAGSTRGVVPLRVRV